MSGLVWAAEDDYQIFATRYRIQATDRDLGQELARLLAPFAYGRRTGVRGRNTFSLVDGHLSASPDPGMVLAYRDCKHIGWGAGPGAAMATVLATLNRIVVEECTDFAVHAGVVTIDDVGVAFPAESGGGKSTLTAACLRNGFAYASDEALVVNGAGVVRRYPKPLALSAWSCESLGIDISRTEQHGFEESFVTHSDLGAELAPPEFALGHVVLAEYGDESVSLQEVPKREAMTALLRLSFNHYKDGERAFHLAADLANDVTVWRLGYGDPLAAAALLRQRLSTERGGSNG